MVNRPDRPDAEAWWGSYSLKDISMPDDRDGNWRDSCIGERRPRRTAYKQHRAVSEMRYGGASTRSNNLHTIVKNINYYLELI